MTARTHRSRPVQALLVLAAALLALAGPWPAVGAHGDEGEMELTRLQQLGVDQVDLEVGVVYAGDGHQAEDATVSATFTGPGGEQVGPVPLDRVREGASLYTTTVQVPVGGTWTVVVSSEEPTAEVVGEVVVDTSENEPPSTPTTVATSTTLTPAEDAEVEGALSDEEGGGVVPIALVAAAVVLVVLGALVLLGRNRRNDGDG